jgi:tryptophan synthase alpha chain
MSRLPARFAELKAQNRAAFIPFITSGDPCGETSFAILEALPKVGADIVELGMPFSDPMADGPAIQASSLRALKAGMTLQKTLALVQQFRSGDGATPIVLMGYYNPIHAYGAGRFAQDAAQAGVDGLIVVDLPPEEDTVLRAHAKKAGLDIVRLATPTTDDSRLKTVLDGASGFLYYVSIAGITGTKSFRETDVKIAVARLRRSTHLPCAVGFGIKTPDQAVSIARFADGAVIGSAIVARIAEALAAKKPRAALVDDVLGFCRTLAKAVHEARAKC